MGNVIIVKLQNSLTNFSKGNEICLYDTLKCLSIVTLKTINFPFAPNGK